MIHWEKYNINISVVYIITMKILSIDVGIKNLAFCLLEVNELDTTSELITKLITKLITDNTTILKWDTINLAQQCEEKKCCEIDKNILCNKPAKFTKNTKCYCLKHSKKHEFKIPSTKLKSAFINKQKISSLYQIADEYNIKYPVSCKKKDIILLINEVRSFSGINASFCKLSSRWTVFSSLASRLRPDARFMISGYPG